MKKKNKIDMIKDLVIIIPIHEINDENKTLLKRAINSVPTEYEIRISCKNGLASIINEIELPDNVVIYENENEESRHDFVSLVNQAVENSEWFSILEFDDEYTDIWFNNVEKYINYNPNVSVFLPLEDVLDYDNGHFLNFGNEAAWASSFSNEIGYIDNDCLEQFFDFYLTGGVFNTKDWQKYGGLKPSIKVSFWYEFLLRMTHNEKKVYVIPKIGYKHYVNRPSSLYLQYKNSLSQKETKWWFDLAKEESSFIEDRNRQYNENNEKEGE